MYKTIQTVGLILLYKIIQELTITITRDNWFIIIATLCLLNYISMLAHHFSFKSAAAVS
ncbi:MAG: hypothetical protein ABJA90_11115 [Ginsengibacter sp.]